MGKAYKAIYYSAIADNATGSDGNTSNTNIATRCGHGFYGWSFPYEYNSGHPSFADLDANTVVQRMQTAGSHPLEATWVKSSSFDSDGLYAVFHAPWFDNTGWANRSALWASFVEDIADRGAAGGVFLDPETFPAADGMFSWSSPKMFLGGDPTDFATKLAKVIERGEQFGEAMVAANPAVHVYEYVSHAIPPAFLAQFTYTDATWGGQPEFGPGSGATSGNIWWTWWPFTIGMMKAIVTGGGKYYYADWQHYTYRTNPARNNWMLYGNWSYMATVARAVVSHYGQATWASIAPRVHYLPFLFPDGDGANPELSETQINDLVLSARDHGMDEKFAVFMLHTDNSWASGWGIDGAGYLARSDDLAASHTLGPAANGDPSPTISITTGSLASGGTITGQAWGRRGVRYVYWTNGTLKYGARMVLKRASDGADASYSTISLTSSTLPDELRVDWELTGLPADGALIVEDVHGATAQIGTFGGGGGGAVAGRAGGRPMLVASRGRWR